MRTRFSVLIGCGLFALLGMASTAQADPTFTGTWRTVLGSGPSNPSGPMGRPSVRQDSVLAYDSDRQKVQLFGGFMVDTNYNDLWEWNGASWTLRSSAAPSNPTDGGLVYDRNRHVLVQFGGDLPPEGTGGRPTAVMEFDGTNWITRNPPVTGGGAGPVGRDIPGLIYDPPSGKVILIGGSNSGAGSPDVWTLDATGWTRECTSAGCMSSAPTATGTFPGWLGYDEDRHLALFSTSFTTEMGVTTYTTWTWNQATQSWGSVNTAHAGPNEGLFYDTVDHEMAGGTNANSAMAVFDGTDWFTIAGQSLPSVPVAYDESSRGQAVAGGNPTYATVGCLLDSDCMGTQYCAKNGACVAQKTTGAMCSLANDCKDPSDCSECGAGFCVDGVCCTTLCAGACKACDLAGSLGTCTDVAAGTSDPRGMCAAATCASTTQLTPAETCDGMGACGTVTAISCPMGESCSAGMCSAESTTGPGTPSSSAPLQPALTVTPDLGTSLLAVKVDGSASSGPIDSAHFSIDGNWTPLGAGLMSDYSLLGPATYPGSALLLAAADGTIAFKTFAMPIVVTAIDPTNQLINPPTAGTLAFQTNVSNPLEISASCSGCQAGTGMTLSYRWDFGDGTAPVYGTAPMHTYAAPGNYDVHLLLADENGGWSEAVGLATITSSAGQSPPSLRLFAESSKPEIGGTVNFTAIPLSGTIVSYAWTFDDAVTATAASGDGLTTTLPAATKTYAQAGSFVAHVVGTDANGLQATDSVTVLVTKGGQLAPEILSRPASLNAKVGAAWNYQPAARGSRTIAWSITPTSIGINPSTGAIHWSPTANQHGAQTITITASNSAGSSTQPLTVQVAPAPAGCSYQLPGPPSPLANVFAFVLVLVLGIANRQRRRYNASLLAADSAATL